MIGMIFPAPQPPEPILESEVPGFLIQTVKLVPHPSVPVEKHWPYHTSVWFLDPWTAEVLESWDGQFRARTFLEAVNLHHFAVFSLASKKGEVFESVSKGTCTGSQQIHALFGLDQDTFDSRMEASREAIAARDERLSL